MQAQTLDKKFSGNLCIGMYHSVNTLLYIMIMYKSIYVS